MPHPCPCPAPSRCRSPSLGPFPSPLTLGCGEAPPWWAPCHPVHRPPRLPPRQGPRLPAGSAALSGAPALCLPASQGASRCRGLAVPAVWRPLPLTPAPSNSRLDEAHPSPLAPSPPGAPHGCKLDSDCHSRAYVSLRSYNIVQPAWPAYLCPRYAPARSSKLTCNHGIVLLRTEFARACQCTCAWRMYAIMAPACMRMRTWPCISAYGS